VPTWNVRIITSLDVQSPTAPDRLAIGSAASNGLTPVGFQPGIGGELGLPGGVTFGAGTEWVGGDPNTSATPNAAGGLSPYFQLRLHLVGGKDGRGLRLGSSATYKFVGFGGNGPDPQDPGEVEIAVSAQYRQFRYEIGVQGVIGKDFATTDADGEFHAYAVGRPLPELALGAATQVRIGLVSQPTDPPADVIAGGIASLTLSRWQLACLGGESTVGLNNGAQVRAGALGEVFGTVRF